AADVARHQKGMMLYNERKYPQAIAILAQVRPSYPAYISARYQLAIIALNSASDDDKPISDDPEKRPFKDWKERAVAGAEDLPPPAGADPSLAESYIRAKMMLAGPYFKAGKFKEMDAVFTPLLAAVENGTIALDKDTKKEVLPSLLKCVLLCAYGKADQHVQA